MQRESSKKVNAILDGFFLPFVNGFIKCKGTFPTHVLVLERPFLKVLTLLSLFLFG